MSEPLPEKVLPHPELTVGNTHHREYEGDNGFHVEEILFGQPISDQATSMEGMSAAPVEPAGAATRSSVIKPHDDAINKNGGDAVAQVAGGLAFALAEVLNTAIQDFEGHAKVGAGASMGDGLHEQPGDSNLQKLPRLKKKTARLLETASEQKWAALSGLQRYEELSSGITSLREADAQQRLALQALHREVRQMMSVFSDRLDTVGRRLEAQQAAFSELESMVLGKSASEHRGIRKPRPARSKRTGSPAKQGPSET